MFLQFVSDTYRDVINGFINNDIKLLSRAKKALITEKDVLKSQRRKLTLCIRQADPTVAMEKNTWFHLSNNMAMSMTYNIRRINEICKEHVDNNFRPLPQTFHIFLNDICNRIIILFNDSEKAIEENNPEGIDRLRFQCEEIKNELSRNTYKTYNYLHDSDASDLTVIYVYLNVIQESQELVTSLRKLLRAAGKLNLKPSQYRSFTRVRTPDI